MRIIETDNFCGDYPDEKFINLPSLPEDICKQICDIINNHLNQGGHTYSRFWRVVKDDYKLQPGFEP